MKKLKSKIPTRNYDDGLKPVDHKKLRESSEKEEIKRMKKSMKMRACK